MLKHRLAENVSQVCIEMLKTENPYPITFDNGKEFTQYQVISKTLGAEIYFPKLEHF